MSEGESIPRAAETAPDTTETFGVYAYGLADPAAVSMSSFRWRALRRKSVKNGWIPATTTWRDLRRAAESLGEVRPAGSVSRRFRNWIDLNHAIGLAFLVAAAVAAPFTAFTSLALIYPVLGTALVGFSLTLAPTWIPIDSPRLDRTQADRVQRITRDVCREIGCREPRIFMAIEAQPNAAATSMLGRGRMVVYSSLLKGMPDNEIAAVIAHEMGHIRQRHLAILRTLTLPLMFVDVDRIVGGALALTHLGSGAAFAVTAGLGGSFVFGINGVMRLAERSADAYAARVTKHPLDLADALQRLGTWGGRRPVERSMREMREHLGALKTEGAPFVKRALVAVGAVLAMGLFRSLANHPPLSKRVAHLERIAARQQALETALARTAAAPAAPAATDGVTLTGHAVAQHTAGTPLVTRDAPPPATPAANPLRIPRPRNSAPQRSVEL